MFHTCFFSCMMTMLGINVEATLWRLEAKLCHLEHISVRHRLYSCSGAVMRDTSLMILRLGSPQLSVYPSPPLKFVGSIFTGFLSKRATLHTLHPHATCSKQFIHSQGHSSKCVTGLVFLALLSILEIPLTVTVCRGLTEPYKKM